MAVGHIIPHSRQCLFGFERIQEAASIPTAASSPEIVRPGARTGMGSAESSLEGCAVLAAKETRLPGVAIVGRLPAGVLASLTGVVVLSQPVKRQIVGRIDDRGGVLAPTIGVLLISCALHD